MVIFHAIGSQRTLSFPGGSYHSFIRYILREEAIFVLKHILLENIDTWYKSPIYKYASSKYKNYLFYLYQYCIDNNFTKSRICINDIAKSILGKNGIKTKKITNYL